MTLNSIAGSRSGIHPAGAAVAREDIPIDSIRSASQGDPNESALVDKVLAGDTQAFAAIVRRWQGPLVNLAWRYCRNRARAEEMAQEAFIRAWRGLAQWRRESSFSTWLFSVAANVYRNELKRTPPVTIPFDQASEPVQAFLHDAELDGRARDEAVRRAVLALPGKYREPVILFYFHDMDLSAAAATMGIAEGTMKARLSRGRDILRRRFPQLRACLDDSASAVRSTTGTSSRAAVFAENKRPEAKKGDRA